MKPAISTLLIAVMFSGCSSGSTPPMQPASSIVPQRTSKVIQTDTGAEIFINGKLVDVIRIGNDGSATHSIAGRTLVDRLKRGNGIAPLAHGGSNDCFADKANLNAANMSYYAATAALIATLGANMAADVMTWGLAIALTGTNVVAYMQWMAAVNARNVAYQIAHRDSC